MEGTSYKGFRPTQDGILIRRDEAPKTSGLLHIPDDAQKAPKTGVVLAVGPGRYTKAGGLVPMEVQVGDRVLFDPLAELRPVVIGDETLYCGAQFQMAGVL